MVSQKVADAIVDAIARIDSLVPRIGKPRQIASNDTQTTWREVKIGNQTFRVLTLED